MRPKGLGALPPIANGLPPVIFPGQPPMYELIKQKGDPMQALGAKTLKVLNRASRLTKPQTQRSSGAGARSRSYTTNQTTVS